MAAARPAAVAMSASEIPGATTAKVADPLRPMPLHIVDPYHFHFQIIGIFRFLTIAGFGQPTEFHITYSENFSQVTILHFLGFSINSRKILAVPK